MQHEVHLSVDLDVHLEFGPVTPTFSRFQMLELYWQNMDTEYEDFVK